MAQSELLRLQRIEVDGLFGIYNHRIDLNLDDRVTLLHGANGVGKTSILRMTYAMLRGDLAHFRRTPFTRFMLGFHDHSKLELAADVNPASEHCTHILRLTNSSGGSIASVDLRPSKAETIAEQADFLRRHEDMFDLWEDMRDGELLTESQLLSRFGERAQDSDRDYEDIGWLSAFLQNANAHLIEAQRLVRTDRQARSRGFMLDRHQTISSVLDCSRDFHKKLDETMAAYGRRAQTLDQSFPQRLMTATEMLGGDKLQERMNVLDKKTADYEEIGILDSSPADHPSNIGSLGDMKDSTQARVMTLYVQDSADKLGELDDFADRTRLFLDNVNTKYRHKRIRLDRTTGLVAVSDGCTELALDALSSGEQQELVLNYDLLFRVPENTVVLIDEPELSLHVAWQKRFLSDLLDIVKLSGFDALIATHSPFIAGVRDDLMVDLDE